MAIHFLRINRQPYNGVLSYRKDYTYFSFLDKCNLKNRYVRSYCLKDLIIKTE